MTVHRRTPTLNTWRNGRHEVVYMAIGKAPFCLALYLTGVHFRGVLQHVGEVNEQKIKC